jgi:hypothetical protein
MQRMDPNLVMILKQFHLENEVFERFAAAGIKYNQLAGLCHDDLLMLGVVERTVQNEIIAEFKTLEGQEPYLEK